MELQAILSFGGKGVDLTRRLALLIIESGWVIAHTFGEKIHNQQALAFWILRSPSLLFSGNGLHARSRMVPEGLWFRVARKD